MEDWEGENDKMFRWVWNTVEDKTDKTRMIKVKRERKKEFRKPIVEEEIEIARLVEEKKDKKED